MEKELYHFTVDPNYSGKNLPGWFLFNTYLQRQLGLAFHFTPFDDFAKCRQAVLAGEVDLVYANPFDWVQYVEKAGFHPIAKAKDHYDEVYLCTAQRSAIRSIEDLPARIRIASASPETLVHMVGLFQLDKAEIDRARLEFVFTGSYQSALKTLLQGNVDLAFVFNEVYDAASRITQDALRIISASADAFAFHAFCHSPRLEESSAKLCGVLCQMGKDPRSAQLLQDVGFAGFAAVTPEEVACLTTLAQEYIAGHEAIDLRATSSIAIDDSAFVVAREDPSQ